jgi:prepilin-type N-terminal cleavage/methylation domain-containing protein
MVTQPPSQGRRQGFTLVEMLAVLAIIGIILAAGLPAVMSLMKSGGVTAASREVSNTMSLARQYAITRRANTRIVFAYYDSQNQGGTLPASNLWYIGYSVVATNPANPTWPWQYLDKWQYLPVGTVFLSKFPGGTGSWGYGYDLDAQSTNLPHDVIPFVTRDPVTGANTTTGVSVAYLEFTPTGAATTYGQLTVVEGFREPGASPPFSVPFRSGTNYFDIAVDNLIGRIRVTRTQ